MWQLSLAENRGLGTHVSFVRSVKMDSWTEAQITKMKQGGNQRCKDFLEKHGVDVSGSIKEKYDNPAAQLYQLVLKARVAGEPEPTELPPPRVKTSFPNRKMAGFGSSPPPKKNESTPFGRRLAAAGALTGAALVAWSMIRNRQNSPEDTHRT